jgi:hypothetical protein
MQDRRIGNSEQYSSYIRTTLERGVSQRSSIKELKELISMKRMMSTKMLSLAVTATIAMFGAVSSAEKTTPFEGTWVLDIKKSTFEPGPPMKGETLILHQDNKGLLHVIDDEMMGDGTSDHLEWSTRMDGSNNPVAGATDFDSVTERLTKSMTYKAVFKKSGKPIAWETARLTTDGKTMHSYIHGIVADGSLWKYHLVFDRQ